MIHLKRLQVQENVLKHKFTTFQVHSGQQTLITSKKFSKYEGFVLNFNVAVFRGDEFSTTANGRRSFIYFEFFTHVPIRSYT